MRVIPLLLTVMTAVSFQNFVTFGGDGADAVFRLSRVAVGGEAAVSGVTSLVMKGTIRVSAGDDGPPERAVEIRMLLPDQYVRIETAKDWTKRSGFSGNTLLTQITKKGVVDTPPANVVPALLRAEKWRFARTLLGVASLATPEVWLTIRQAPGSGQSGTARGASASSTTTISARLPTSPEARTEAIALARSSGRSLVQITTDALSAGSETEGAISHRPPPAAKRHGRGLHQQ